MNWLFQPLLILIAKSTESQLAQQIEYLKAENTILRKRLPKKVMLTEEEKRLLVKLGQAVGVGMRVLINVVSYMTYRRWLKRYGSLAKEVKAVVPRRKGRPKTSDEICQLVLKLAKENDWGYTRILGELKKLGIKTSRSNVVNILKRNELDPRTDPEKGTWATFLKAHSQTLWQCDFFSKHIITAEGIRQCFVLAFVHMTSRRVFITPCTYKPDSAWMVAQAEAFLNHLRSNKLEAGIVLRDRDGKFSKSFNDALTVGGVTAKRVPFRSPNMNAYVERFVQSIQQECLDKFITFGQEHLDYLISEYVGYYHYERPHQAKGNELLVLAEGRPTGTAGEVMCSERLGGVLRHYSRRAA